MRLSPSRFLATCLLVGLPLAAGCELSMGGPESAAMGHVRLLVESDADTPETVKAYAHLPNRVIIEYARALRAQGVDLRYDARKISAAPDGTVSIGVSIVPARKQNISEREHTLVVTLKKENNQRWAVTGIRARP